MPAQKTDSQESVLPQASFPALEGFVEQSPPERADELFAPVKQALAGVRGPQAVQVKKAQVAIERTEELLRHLFSMRRKLEEERRGAPKARK